MTQKQLDELFSDEEILTPLLFSAEKLIVASRIGVRHELIKLHRLNRKMKHWQRKAAILIRELQ
jgi:hypothetical protein